MRRIALMAAGLAVLVVFGQHWLHKPAQVVEAAKNAAYGPVWDATTP